MKFTRLILTGIIAVLLASVSLIPAVAAPGDNIALNSAVESCQFINDEERDAFLVDDDVNYATKWCATDGAEHEADGSYHWIIVDFGAEKTFGKIRLVKASEGERDFGSTSMDASAFYFEVSSDKINWTKILDINGNESVPIYEGNFEPVAARYLKLTLTAAEANPGAVATVRLYDLKVFEALAAASIPEEAATDEPTAPVLEVTPVVSNEVPEVPRTGVASVSALLITALSAAVMFDTIRQNIKAK